MKHASTGQRDVSNKCVQIFLNHFVIAPIIFTNFGYRLFCALPQSMCATVLMQLRFNYSVHWVYASRTLNNEYTKQTRELSQMRRHNAIELKKEKERKKEKFTVEMSMNHVEATSHRNGMRDSISKKKKK